MDTEKLPWVAPWFVMDGTLLSTIVLVLWLLHRNIVTGSNSCSFQRELDDDNDSRTLVMLEAVSLGVRTSRDAVE